jgi:hypothetical protein
MRLLQKIGFWPTAKSSINKANPDKNLIKKARRAAVLPLQHYCT